MLASLPEACSTQRFALNRYGGDLVAALWPAELKPQAEHLYGRRLATSMVAKVPPRPPELAQV